MPDKSLHGFQINRALGYVAELLSADQVRRLRGPVLAVCNTSPSHAPGSHWIVICIDNRQRGEFFDSFGMPPAVYGLDDSMERSVQWTFNDIQLQHPASSVCGHYAIAYSLAKLSGIAMSEFVAIFSSDTRQNDRMIFKLIHAML